LTLPLVVDTKIYKRDKQGDIPLVPVSKTCYDRFDNIVRNLGVNSATLLVGSNQIGKTAAVDNFVNSLKGDTLYIKIDASSAQSALGVRDSTDCMVTIINQYYQKAKKLANGKQINVVVCIDEIDNKDLTSQEKFKVDLDCLKSNLLEKYVNKTDSNGNSEKPDKNINFHFFACANNSENFVSNANPRRGQADAVSTFCTRMCNVQFNVLDSLGKAKLCALRLMRKKMFDTIDEAGDLTETEVGKMRMIECRFNERKLSIENKAKMMMINLANGSALPLDTDSEEQLKKLTDTRRQFYDLILEYCKNRDVEKLHSTLTPAKAILLLGLHDAVPVFTLTDLNAIINSPNSAIDGHNQIPLNNDRITTTSNDA
jgi:hypothetical protein